MRRVGRLFEQVASFENLNRAFLDAARGHRTRPAVQGFRVELERRLFEIRAELLDGDYRWGEYRSFYVADTKRRLILAAPFRDRVVHHALVQVLEPVLDPTFIDGCFACRKGKGNHAAVERLRAWVERSPRADALSCDVRHYFRSVDHQVLLGLLEHKVKDRRVLELTATLLSTIPAEAAAGPGRGIPIGNLTSQLFANVYLSPLDHYAQQHLGLRRYLRYVDDLVAVDEDRQRLQASREALQSFAHERLRLSFHPTKVTVAPVRAGVDFLGFVVFPTHLRVRRAAVCRFRRRERDLRRGYWQGRLTAERYWRSVVSWTAHAAHADSAGLLASLGLGGFR